MKRFKIVIAGIILIIAILMIAPQVHAQSVADVELTNTIRNTHYPTFVIYKDYRYEFGFDKKTDTNYIYKQNLKTNKKTILVKNVAPGSSGEIQVTDKYVFYSAFDLNEKMSRFRVYRIGIDGKNKKVIKTDVYQFMVSNGKIYYSNDGLYTCDFNGKNVVKLSKTCSYIKAVTNDYIYYSGDNAAGNMVYYQFNLKTKKNKTMTKNIYPIGFDGNYTYCAEEGYKNNKSFYTIYRLNTKTNKLKKMTTINYSEYNALKYYYGKVFYQDSEIIKNTQYKYAYSKAYDVNKNKTVTISKKKVKENSERYSTRQMTVYGKYLYGDYGKLAKIK